MNTFFFDLDGTLLPFDQEEFMREYFTRLTAFFHSCPISADQLKKAIWLGTDAMAKNDGSMTNEQLFWKVMSTVIAPDFRKYEPVFLRFYETEFQEIRSVTTCRPEVKACIEQLRAKGYALYLTTNPLFPAIATHSRVRWAGLKPEYFEFITTYENSSFCKPNLDYYRNILERFQLDPAQCMMVGNDTAEDMCAAELGLSTYLLTDCLIHRDETPPVFPLQGSLQDFVEYARLLPDADHSAA